jgi:S1-C subfamily serine protease
VTRAKADALEERPGTIGDLAATPAGGWRFTRVGLDGAALGLLAGDVIREVNGYPLGSEVELAVAWAALRGASDFDVKIRRDGAARTHHVQILR